MRDFRWPHVWLLLALVAGQALFALHAAQHPLAAAADYDCVACNHGFDGQALAAATPLLPAIDLAAATAPLPAPPAQISPTASRPPIRGPPLLPD